jgi:hypothetical protein
MASSVPGSEGGASPKQEWDEAKDALTPVLEATLLQGKRPVSPEEWRCLRQIAARHPSQGRSFEEFAIELVAEFLRGRLPASVVEGETFERMSRAIGGTLCSDPVSKQRLIELQKQLLEGS